MKKRVFKRKKKITAYGKRKGAKRALILAAAVSLLTAAIPAYGRELEALSDQQAPKTVITDIHHRHVGNTSAPGGCYNIPMKHEHIGNERTGGECYQTPIYHRHQGNENENGGCYVTEVAHDHIGDEVNGGPCYGPAQTHTHTGDCFLDGACVRSFTPEEIIGTDWKKCFQHQETTFVTVRGKEIHDSCPKGTISNEWTYCQLCGPNSPSIHDYQEKVCGMEEGQVIRYGIVCPKTVERYEPGCGKEDGDIDSYDISCKKDVDGYKPGCGLEEDELCGRLIVTNETEGKQEQVTLSVRLEDLTGGKLKPAANPYIWKDESGNQIGAGERIQVDQNGTYFVTLELENKDVDEKGLSSRILIDNIYKAQPADLASPTGAPMPSDTPAPAASPAPTDAPKPDAKGDKGEDAADDGSGEEENENDIGKPDESNHKTKREEPDALAGEGDDDSKPGGSIKKFTGHAPENTPSPSPVIAKPMLKETKEVVLPEKKAAGEGQYKVGQKAKERGLFTSVAARVISITAGMAVLLLGISLLLWYLRNSVRVYNDDGKGRMLYLGRCTVDREEEAYSITITDAMIEKAYTNRYCLKPGLFLVGRKEGEDLVIHKEAKRTAVRLDKEMIVML